MRISEDEIDIQIIEPSLSPDPPRKPVFLGRQAIAARYLYLRRKSQRISGCWLVAMVLKPMKASASTPDFLLGVYGSLPVVSGFVNC